MQTNANAKRSVLKPAPPTSSPNTANGKYISPKTTKILNNNANHNTTSSEKNLSSRGSSQSSIDKPTLAKEDSTECLFEIQGLEPAPGTTYHQIVVYAPLENPKSKNQMARKNGAVVLREWPRLRYSQKYSRDAGPNPAEISFTYDEFLEIVDELQKGRSETELRREKLRAIEECSSKISNQLKMDWVQSNQTFSSNTKDKIINIFGEQKFREIVDCVKKGIDINNNKGEMNGEKSDY